MEMTITYTKGAFNNYVDKKGERGVSKKFTHVDKKLKENYRRIMANDHACMQYIGDD